jgi:hypothetical protein
LPIRQADFDHNVAAFPPDLPGAGDFPPINYIALVMANRAGQTSATEALVDQAKVFLADVDNCDRATSFKRAS